jgi:DNA polymerase (family X)
MTNRNIARILKETAALIELTGGNTFRARAFESAARTIDSLEESVAQKSAAGSLTEIAGIGAGLAAQIGEVLERGSFDLRDELLEKVPAGLLQVLRVKGLGVKKVKVLWERLGIISLDGLEAAANEGRIAGLEGFGKKTEQKIADEIARIRLYLLKRRYFQALPVAEALRDELRGVPDVFRAEISGEIRRKLEVVSEIELVVAAHHAERFEEAVGQIVPVSRPSPDSSGRMVIGELPDSFPIRIHVCEPADFGRVLWETTGSEAHVARIAGSLGDVSFAEETDIFDHLGIPFIEPELREDTGEVEAANEDRLPRLIDVADLRGSLHNHSNYSDGSNTLLEMAEATRSRGLSYFGICDHSRSLVIANGMPIERALKQREEVERLNASFAANGSEPFRVFWGIESDILSDGSLDYPEDVLAKFDLIVASVHQGFNMTEKEATERLIAAVRNPFTTILGHMTGRLLLSREGYPVDHAAVIDACAEEGVAIELNANPHRLDMDWRWIRYATDRGVLIAINPDAHLIAELDLVEFGVAVARKGWLTAAQCLNALDLPAFEAWLAAHRARRPVF